MVSCYGRYLIMLYVCWGFNYNIVNFRLNIWLLVFWCYNFVILIVIDCIVFFSLNNFIILGYDWCVSIVYCYLFSSLDDWW